MALSPPCLVEEQLKRSLVVWDTAVHLPHHLLSNIAPHPLDSLSVSASVGVDKIF